MKGYMNRKDIIKSAAHGNAEAEQFLTAFVRRANVLDDLFDRDKPVSDEALAQAEMEWLMTLTANTWFNAHKTWLVPLMVMGLNGWVDSNRKEHADQADLLKSLYHEVVYATAFLTGGWPALRHMSGVREIDWEPSTLNPQPSTP